VGEVAVLPERAEPPVGETGQLVLVPLLVQEGVDPEIVVADMKLREADLVLGVDLLSSRRLWLSYGSRRIFISSR